MNPDALYDRYLAQLQQAMNADEQASAAQQRGRFPQAAQGYEEAAALYSQAAKALLEVGEISSAREQGSIEGSVDRLIAISRDLTRHAKSLRENPPAAPVQPLPTGEEEGEASFTPAQAPGVTFDDIAGLEDAKQLILDEIIHPILHRELYQRFHVENNGGLLLFGPPGSGKTMIARAIANQAHMAFFSVRCSDIVGKYFGEAEKHVQSLFNAAREAKNAVIFLDEAEALACRRGGNSTVMNRLIAQLHGVQMAQTRQDTLSHIQQAGACIDTDALIRAEDALAVRREMKREEDERMSAAFAAAAAEAPEMPENEEFARLVRQAQALRAENTPAQREAEKIPV